jgi:hypothetical protein
VFLSFLRLEIVVATDICRNNINKHEENKSLKNKQINKMKLVIFSRSLLVYESSLGGPNMATNGVLQAHALTRPPDFIFIIFASEVEDEKITSKSLIKSF